jgi:hypothetical protein
VDQNQRLPGPTPYVVQFHGVDILPDWEPGTPGVLCVAGPHAIPVSTALRASDRRVMLALGRGRDTLARLRADPRAAFCLLGAEVAFTAYGPASVIREELSAASRVAAVALEVERVQDHLAGSRTEMLAGARWRFTEDPARDDAERILAELNQLGAAGPAG